MKIALFEPYSPELLRGNSIAAERLSGWLSHYGVSVRFFSLYEGHNKTRIINHLCKFQPDFLHGFHACKTGPLVKEISGELHIPYIISMRGTDAYEDAMKKAPCKKMSSVLKDACCIVVFHPFMKKTLLNMFPSVKNKIKIISQGVDISSPLKRNPRAKENAKTVSFGYAGGIRKLKGIHLILTALKKVHRNYSNIRFYMAGPVIEDHYAKTILKEIHSLPWSTYLGEIPHKNMSSFYNLIDVYVNASISEGASNAVLEAMWFKKCVLASRAEGNRAIIRNAKNGYLFSSSADLARKSEFLITHPESRESTGSAAEQFVKHFHSAEQEAKKYYYLYHECL